MNRREFLAALFGSAAATAFLPVDGLATAFKEPRWLSQAAALELGDVFTIAGVYSLNPLTHQSTGLLQQFVLASATAPVVIYPRLMTEGPYANCTSLPSDDAELSAGWTVAQAE